MILPNPRDAIHKAWLYRVLTAICDSPQLSGVLYFKGGTCAALRGFLDRFSIDIDFDYVGAKAALPSTRQLLEDVFAGLGLEIKDKSVSAPQYFLKYPADRSGQRNTLKIDITMPPPTSNKYEAVRLDDIDRVMYCQTAATMFGNKLVALIERFEKNGSIAGRDLYDIHHFFLQGLRYDAAVIRERRGVAALDFFRQLVVFVEDNVTQTTIDQDINMLLPDEKFQRLRKVIKPEVLLFLKDEAGRLAG